MNKKTIHKMNHNNFNKQNNLIEKVHNILFLNLKLNRLLIKNLLKNSITNYPKIRFKKCQLLKINKIQLIEIVII